VVAIVTVPLAPPPVFAGEINNPQIKRIYTAEDAPPEIRFRQLLSVLTLYPDETGDRGNRRLQELGIASQDVEVVRAYLETLHEQAQAEIDEGIWRIGCNSDVSALGGLEIRVVYNSFDELRYAVAAKYLAIASAELANKGYPDFLFMIEGYPGSNSSFTVMSTDHRFAWGDEDQGIQENRAVVCQGIRERLGKQPD